MKPKCPCEHCSCPKPEIPASELEHQTIYAAYVPGLVEQLLHMQKHGWLISGEAHLDEGSHWKVTLSRPKI